MSEQTKPILTRQNATAGATVIFRAKPRVIDEVGPMGVWLKAARKGKPRDFLYFYEAVQFGVRVDAAEGGAR